MKDDKNILDLAQENKAYMIELRRHFHANPELSLQEYKTCKKICHELDKMQIEHEVVLGTGVIAYIDAKNPVSKDMPAIGLRADMDALPIQEQNDVEYTSKNKGVMHACGHDAHVAILLGAAKILKSMNLSTPVKLIFQPAEETISGAKLMAELPQIKNLANIAGVHVWSPLPTGLISTEAGPRMARADFFEIKINGRGAHGATPNDGVDALFVASMFVTALQAIISREIDPRDPAVVTIGSLKAGSAGNIIAHEAILTGTIRSFDNDIGNWIIERIKKILFHITAAYGATSEYIPQNTAPALINDEFSSKIASECAKSIVGEEGVVTSKPMMGAEDFSFYLENTPGVFAFIGCSNHEKGIDKPHHNNQFDIDENSLVFGAAFLAKYALKMGEQMLLALSDKK